MIETTPVDVEAIRQRTERRALLYMSLHNVEFDGLDEQHRNPMLLFQVLGQVSNECQALRRVLWERHGHHGRQGSGEMVCMDVDFSSAPVDQLVAHMNVEMPAAVN